VYDERGNATADLMTLKGEGVHDMETLKLRHPIISSIHRTLQKEEITRVEPLLVDVVKKGEIVYQRPDMARIRSRRASDLEKLDPGVTRLINPHVYHVSVSETLWQLKRDLIEKYKNNHDMME
jgi:nicotinate phosphoribosyltransferase